MTDVILSGQEGTPLFVIEKDSYNSWLDQQSDNIQAWLSDTQYKGEGLSLLPGNNGKIEAVLYSTSKINDPFICGDLPTQLPAGQYKLQEADKALTERIAFSWGVGSYRFTRYKNDERKLAQLVVNEAELAEKSNSTVAAIALVRDLVNTPAADMMPQHLANVTEALGQQFGAQVTQIIGDELLAENYPTVHMVGRASEHAPRLIDLSWGNENHPKVTLVGKGVCFDSGGLDIKPSAGMRYMKKDMGGAAHVLGLARLIMSNELPVRLRVLIPAVENAVSGNSFRPGDVIKTRKGLTVEIDNTDAEGRLVLCDALAEAQADNPELIIDFATLTGAARVAVGTELPAFFCNNPDFSAELKSGGVNSGDLVWELPLHEPYRDMIKSDIADLMNCAASPFGGAITAALYLQAFVEPTTTWAHFDIMAWNNRKLPGRPIGGETFGVRAVFDTLKSRYTG